MQQVARFLLIVGAVALLAPAVTEAHFKLVEPAPWIVENQRGDDPPCNGRRPLPRS